MRRLVLLLMTMAAVMTSAAAASARSVADDLDGLRIGHVPAGVGTSTDFRYEYDDVGFVSRDRESRTAEGWQVDLSIAVLRGEQLSTARRLRDWVLAYEERPADEVTYRRTTVRGKPGWRCADEIFWLLRPGVAVVVRLDTARWSQAELTRTARSIRPAVRPVPISG